MQTLLDAVVKASDLYYLHNGTYPQDFDELDIGIDLPTSTISPCFPYDLGTIRLKQIGDFAIAIHSGNNSNLSINVLAAYFTKGKYKCRGFTRVQKWQTEPHNHSTYCMEAYYNLACGTNCENGIFCTKVMGKNYQTHTAGGQMAIYN